MKTVIYYFSGTGNSLWAAKAIAQKTGGALLPIASNPAGQPIFSDADRIGFVFPVYYEDLPAIVRNFALHLSAPGSSYIFAVCTFGGAAGRSLWRLKRIFAGNNVRLSACFGIRMPQNAFLKRGENREKILVQCSQRLDGIINGIISRKHGTFYPNPLLEAIIFPLQPLIQSLCKKQFMKLSGESAQKSAEELLHLTDISYSVNANCTICGTCAGVCPVRNIQMTEKGPVWLHRCETCLACINWCPRHAIQGGVPKKEYFYRHPEIQIKEIMDQQSKETV